MKRNKIIFIIVFLIFLILTIFTLYNYNKQSEYIDIKQKQSFTILQQIIDGKIIFFRKLISKRVSDELYETSRLKKFIISDDKRYKDELLKVYKVLKRENSYIKSLHFISPENICKFSARNPKANDHDISKFRRIVVEANNQKRSKYGFEVGYNELLYRLEIPLYYDNKYYGLIEVGVSPKLFISDMSIIDKYLDASVVIASSKIQELLKYDIGDKVVIEKAGYALFEDKPLFEKILEDGLINSDKMISFENENYKLFHYNLLSFDGKVEGKFLITTYVTADKDWKDNSIIMSLIILAVLLVLFFIVIYFGFNYYDKKIVELIEHDKQNERLLYQQSKMASMGEMIGNIAHQWRQPLSAITTAASGMKLQKEYELLDDKNFDSAIENIMKQAAYMSKTIDDFRDFFRSDKEKIKFNLKSSIVKDIDLLGASLRVHGINVELDLNDNIELVGNQNEFTQAVLNIINNAKDQLNRIEQQDKFIKVEDEEDKNCYKVIICDNGGGISKDIITKIFEPYFTTKHQSQGTGIGLYMTSEIISKHFFGKIEVLNKDIEYEGKTYKGACFIITLPKNLEDLEDHINIGK